MLFEKFSDENLTSFVSKSNETMIQTLINDNAIPIIDMAYIRPRDVWPIKSCTRQSAHKLYKALVDQGLALLVNHGITEMKLQQAYRRLDHFSKLPEDARKFFEASENGMEKSGYYFPGPKIAGSLVNYKHTYNLKSNEKNQMHETFTFNNCNPLETLVDDFKALASTLLQFIAIGIGISPKYFRNVQEKILTENDESLFQLIHYPPTDDCELCDERCSKEKTEDGMFVLIAQDSESGLEVLQSKKWVTVGFLPGAILLICGNLLKVWSEELCVPVSYRFNVPPDQNVRSRLRHCSIFASRLPSNTVQLCPASTPQIQIIDNLTTSIEDLSDDNEGNLAPFQRAVNYVCRVCRIACKCTS